jgi:opacity protein-like surface antigen
MMKLAAASLLLLAGSPALAQAPSPSGWSFSLEGGFGVQSETDLDADAGSFDLHRTFVSGSVDYRWNYRNSVGVSVGGGRSEYRFYDSVGTEMEEPWTDIDEMRLSVPMRLALGKTSTLFVIPTVRYNGEKDASSSDSQTWGLFGGAAWRLNEDLTIGPGLGVFSRFEDSTRVFPILIIDWNITERWNLATGRGLAASQGPGLTLSYALTPSWKLGLSGRYEEIQFRLDDEGAAPGGIGEDRAMPLVFNTNWSPNPAVRLGVFAGVELGGELTLYDDRGKKLESRDYDPSALYGATFEFNF